MTTFEENYESAQTLISDGRHAEAIAALEQIVAEDDTNAAVHFDLGNLHYATGESDKALRHFSESARLAPENPTYLKNYADLLYSEKKDADGALALYDKILALHPEDIPSLMMTGHLCVSQEKFGRALSYYNRVLDIEPWNVEAQQFFDQVQKRTGAEGGRATPEAAYQRSQTLVEQGRIEEAVAVLEALIAHHPDFALAHNDLGVLYYQLADKDRSLDSYEKATALEPQNANFMKNLADFYMVEQGAVEKALTIYLSVLKDNPEDVDALMVAGHISSVIGNTDAAKVFYERVLDIEPWHLEASERMEQL